MRDKKSKKQRRTEQWTRALSLSTEIITLDDDGGYMANDQLADLRTYAVELAELVEEMDAQQRAILVPPSKEE